jgi:hypothetical protein
MATTTKTQVATLLLLFLIMILTFVTYKASNQAGTITTDAAPPQNQQVSVSVSSESISMTREEAIANADLIVEARVINISATQWNQDNGEYWQETTVYDAERGLETSHSAWPIHTIELSIVEPIIDAIGVGQTVTLTVLGKSPGAQDPTVEGQSIQVAGGPSPTLSVGDEVILFATQGEIAWRDPSRPIRLVEAPDGTTYFDVGTRSIISFLASPADSYLVKQDDGLYHSVEGAIMGQEPLSRDALLRQIAEVRPNTSQIVAPLDCPLILDSNYDYEAESGYETPQQALDNFDLEELPLGTPIIAIEEDSRVIWSLIDKGTKVGSITAERNPNSNLWNISGSEKCSEE